MEGLFVYILRCADDSYYIGVTNNLERRILEHTIGLCPEAYTYSKRPILLVWSNLFLSTLEAIRWEKKLKSWTRKKKEALINGDFKSLKELSECRNETHYKNKSY